jgi:pimeloyl-ACP methyl ester carboxylesterase
MSTKFLHRQDGFLAYDDSGTPGPLVLMVPSLGDVRAEYRFAVPPLVAAGYRVVTLDMRGHGESSTGWPDYSLAAVGSDILALIEHLAVGPAVVVATSYPAGAAVWAAAERPAAVQALVLIGAFVRNISVSPVEKLALNLTTSGPWKVWAWDIFYNSLYPSQKPADFADYRRRLKANLSEPGRVAALKAMANEPRDASATRLEKVQAPALVVMGSKDPDFKSPAEEAEFIAKEVGGRVAIIDGAGHYPHAEIPAETVPVITDFLAEVTQIHGAATQTQ